MIEIRPFASLGAFRNDWLNARHHFSFGHYMDRDRMQFGALRVWNDDEIGPGAGFDPHPHREMEIITYVRKGAITHQDSLGNRGRTAAGDVQVMSAGTGIVHAEYNQESEPTELFQIWIMPDRARATPRWDARVFPKEARNGSFAVLASGRPSDAAVAGDAAPLLIHADAAVMGATLKAGESASLAVAPGRKVYLVPVRGAVRVNGVPANPRDGVAISDEASITITATDETEVVAVEVA